MTTEEAARILLPRMMSDISEEAWSAGWMSGLEYDLWDCMHDPSRWITDERRGVLLWLAEAAGGWFYWSKQDGPVFIAMDAWRERYAAWQQEQAEMAGRGGGG